MEPDEKLTTEETISVLSQFRDMIYRLLSRVFSEELDKNALEGVQNIWGVLHQATDLSQFYKHEHFREGQKGLKNFFDENRKEINETMITDLAKAYASLFLGVGHQTIGLCESVYKSDQGLLFQSSHFEVQEAYQKIGMAKSHEFHEPADHIAVELSYMAQLCRLIGESMTNERGQAAQYLELQKAFCKKHLLSWVPDFTRKVIEDASSSFYSSMGYLLNGFIQDDTRLMDLLIKEVE
ncbi:MAG: molecular chaperone TorD family protein [Deltaproteobacteria bacterium]|nr:molecular chaperone TorD family protein [Deltaproteobacteria bacterium]